MAGDHDSEDHSREGAAEIDCLIRETELAIENTGRFLEQMGEQPDAMREYLQEVKRGLRSRLVELERRRERNG